MANEINREQVQIRQAADQFDTHLTALRDLVGDLDNWNSSLSGVWVSDQAEAYSAKVDSAIQDFHEMDKKVNDVMVLETRSSHFKFHRN